MKRAQCHGCFFFRTPVWHSGYTGMSGPSTWYQCSWIHRPLRDIKSCELEGDREKQLDELIKRQREN